MNTRFRTPFVVALAILASAALPSFARAPYFEPGAEAGVDAGGGVYLATLHETTSILGRSITVPIRIRLDRLTTDAEVEALAGAAKRGQAAFREVFFAQALGRIEIDGRLGDPIYYARRYSDQQGEHLIVVGQRFVSAADHFANRRSVRYPYSVVELDLDAEGTMGSYTFAARLEPQRDGTIDYRSFSFVPARLLAVRRLEG
jgi:hypothetical protein